MFLLRRPLSLATWSSPMPSGPACLREGMMPRPRRYSPFLFFLLILLPFASAMAQQYPASAIPEELKKDADAVVRTGEYEIEIKSPSRAVIRERHVITILNPRADDMADYRTYYSKMSEINSVEAVLYNSAGKELKHFKKKDMTDRPLWDGQTLATDTRYKEGSLSSHEYPYTVRFEEEDEMIGIEELIDWMPQPARNAAVEYSRYSITAPKGYQIRYKMMNSVIKPVTTEVKDKINYTWEIRNIKPVPEESFAGAWNATQPYMLVGPSVFEAAGYKGDMSSWSEYGKFYSALSRGRDVLPEDIRNKVHALVAGEQDVRKKIAILYEYLQKNTHYISIQLGIGGLQPFDATYVSRNKYGDCKALSNFMMALLKEAGIPANVVIIRGGKNATDFQPDFPGHQFNHAICCVPLNKDTVWLECTDQYLPAGYLSSFTANRYGLLITENGGKLVHTPDYALSENRQVRVITAQLDSEGNLSLRSRAMYRAEQQDPLESSLHHLSRAEQETRLKKQFDLPTYDITAFDYQPESDQGLPVMHEFVEISVNGYAQMSGKRLFINPDMLTRSNIAFPAGEIRQRALEFRDSYSVEDSVEISIPEGYVEEAVAKGKSLKTSYGEYQTATKISPGKITYYRSFKQFRGSFPASSYSEASGFYNTIYRSDRDKIVLVKKQ